MDGLLKSDIFFFITSVVVVLLGIGVGVAVVYVIRILRDIKAVSKTIKEETDEVAQDISILRSRVKEGRAIGGILSFVRGLFARRKKGRNH
jgi:hypothetical protein